MGGEFVQLAQVIFVVGRRIGVTGIVAIPGGKINAELQAIFSRGLGDFAHQVTLASFPGTAFHAVIRQFTGPEAEAVVMLGYEDDVLCTGGFD